MQAVRATEEVRKGRNQLAATVVVGHAFKHIYNSGLQSILLPEIKLGLGLSATQLGTLAFSRQATGWVATLGAGYLGDRFVNHASLMLGASLALMGVSHFLIGSAPTYWLMFLAMLFVGVGPSLYHPPAIGALSRRFPDKRGFAISVHGTGGSVGEVLGPLVTAGALAFLMWRDVLRVSALPAILAGFVIWAMMRSVPGEVPGSSSAKSYLSSLTTLLRRRRLLLLVAVTALGSMGQSSVHVFLPVYLREDLDFSVARVAVYLALAQVVGIVAQPVMGLLSDKFGRKSVLVPGMGALGLLFLALTGADTGLQLLLTVLAMGAFLYTLHAIFVAAAIDVAGDEIQATVVSLIYGASFLGTVSPIIAGALADNYGTSSVFLYGGSVTLVATVLLAVPPAVGSRLGRIAPWQPR